MLVECLVLDCLDTALMGLVDMVMLLQDLHLNQIFGRMPMEQADWGYWEVEEVVAVVLTQEFEVEEVVEVVLAQELEVEEVVVVVLAQKLEVEEVVEVVLAQELVVLLLVSSENLCLMHSVLNLDPLVPLVPLVVFRMGTLPKTMAMDSLYQQMNEAAVLSLQWHSMLLKSLCYMNR